MVIETQFFFHSFASFSNRRNRISVLLDGDRRLENKEEICDHVVDYYKELFSEVVWDRPSLDNLQLPMITEAEADIIESL